MQRTRRRRRRLSLSPAAAVMDPSAFVEEVQSQEKEEECVGCSPHTERSAIPSQIHLQTLTGRDTDRQTVKHWEREQGSRCAPDKVIRFQFKNTLRIKSDPTCGADAISDRE